MAYQKNTVIRSAGYTTVVLLFVAFCVFTLSCVPAFASETYVAQGRASWYGTSAHGKQTANGEIYNRHALTAAHNGLPFGTIVRVHNLKNGKHVLVRVNDRGPFVQGRIVDVSLKAAQILGMTNAGVVPVRLEIVAGKKGKPLNGENAFYVHIANERSAFKARGQAAKLSKRLGMPVKTLYRPNGPGKGFALCLGPFKGFKEAHRQFMKLEESATAGIGVIEAPTQDRVPFYTPGEAQRLYSNEQRQQLLEQHNVLWKTLAAPCHPAFYALSLLAMSNKSFLLAGL
ncbi:MAG: septal ring lytic transglycosylase RlpA family protein [Desulfovibrionaceae bacterium]|nr:septal ring lytic transglycosylase RlpA family protein [Desulfovibrionaceae bacterium]